MDAKQQVRQSFTCPVCGYPSLTEPVWTDGGGASFEICPSCGFQFGVSDVDEGYSYGEWRQLWVEGGMKWNSPGVNPPDGWVPDEQLRSVS